MKETNKGITLVALIITIIVMLILVGVTIQLVINSGLFETAKNVTIKTEEEYRNESAIGNEITIDGTTYSSIEEYIKQLNCTHEWGDWNKNPENCVGTGTCTKCGKVETAQLPHTFQDGICTVCGHNLIIGAKIIGYDPSVAENGSKIDISYTSVKGEDEYTGNGYKDQTFQVASIEGWRVLKEENGQIIITTDNPIQSTENLKFYLQGKSGYLNSIEELNKISSIYGLGKYADTSKYKINLNENIISTAGRCIKIEDVGITQKTTGTSAIFSRNAETGYIEKDGIETTSVNFVYYDETDKIWKNLEAGEKIIITRYDYNNNQTAKQKELVKKNIAGEDIIEYWVAHNYNYLYSMVMYCASKGNARNRHKFW